MPRFQSFIQAGFACATHRNSNNKRLDVAAASRHNEFVAQDYARLAELGVRTVREGARWHVIEYKPGLRDFTSLEAVFSAAEDTGMEVILDLMHFGWPDFLQIFSPGFVQAFESFALAAARFVKRRGIRHLSVIPVNEMSYLAWAGGEAALMGPHERGRGANLKRQLVKAALAASRVLKQELPAVTLMSAEPLPAGPHRVSMFEATDMLLGRSCPELGGSLELLDVVGVNFSGGNGAGTGNSSDAGGRPLRQLLQEVYERYRKPVSLTRTGSEGDARAEWFQHVCEETRAALSAGVPVAGVCLNPIVNHPGWDDDRRCENGLWDYANDAGEREIYLPLADAIERERSLFGQHSRVAA